MRREIKADVWKQHDLYVNNLVGDVKANPRETSIRLSMVRKRHPRYSTFEKGSRSGVPSRILKRQKN